MRIKKYFSCNKFFNNYILLIITVLVVIFISFIINKYNEHHERNVLLDNAKIVAAAINIDNLEQLKGNESDLKLEAYKHLKNNLINIRLSSNSFKFLYIIGQKGSGDIFFYVDSQPPDASNYAPPGEIYKDVPAEYLQVFSSKQNTTVGPVTDHWGTMITALSPIIDPKTGDVLAVVGLDILVDDWYSAVLIHSFPLIGFNLLVILSAALIISLLRKSKRKIYESEETYRNIFQNAQVGLFRTRISDGKVIEANNALALMVGYKNREEYIRDSDPTKKFVDPADRDKMIADIVTNGSVYKYESRFFHIDGSIKWGSYSATIFPEKGWIEGVLEDITDIKKAKEKLKENEQRLNTLINSSPDAIFFKDGKGRWIEANKSGLELFNLTNIDYRNKTDEELSEISTFHKDALLYCKTTDEEIWQNGAIDNREEVIPSSNGKERIYDVIKVPLFNKDKSRKGIVIIGRNITQRKEKEDELRAAKEKAEESDRLKSAFLSNMSHEIRTPMNGIVGFLNLLSNPTLTVEEKQKFTSIINKSSARLLNTINDLIDIAKIESGQMKVSISETSINNLIEEVNAFFTPQVSFKGLSLIPLPTLDADKAIILTDNDKLHGILTNLIKNAIKYTKQGSITFGYILKNDFIEFFVKDTGAGIPVSRQQAIFNRFEQADIEDKRAFEGSGLGLAIAKAYVEMLGGKIWLLSEEGKGSKFMFTIPYKINTSPSIQIEEKSTDEIIPENAFENYVILIAEDDDVSSMLFDSIVQSKFKQTIYAKTGKEAVDACKSNPEINLVLMDMKMPLMNGYNATRKIRETNKDVIIIAQTAYAQIGDKEKAIKVGCNDYITKPINKNQLLRVMNHHLNRVC